MKLKQQYKQDINERYPKIVNMLGKVPDPLLARKYGVTTQSITYMRNRLEIKPFNSSAPKHLKRFFRCLGKKSDVDVAKRCNVSVSTVYNWRRRLSIPSYRDSCNNKLRNTSTSGKISREGIEYLVLSGLSDVDIGWRINCSTSYVGKIRRKELGYHRARGSAGPYKRSGTYTT